MPRDLPIIYKVLKAYGLDPAIFEINPFGSGLINHTYKLSGHDDEFILQRINKSIFKTPQLIANNLRMINDHLSALYPDYLFAAPLNTIKGESLVEVAGEFYRLTPFIKNSYTVDFLTDSRQAYEAAKQFGKFTAILNDFDIVYLNYTLPDFHNLDLRVIQFNESLITADEARINQANTEIALIEKFKTIGDTYQNIRLNGFVPVRVIHHDTKINNVLFDNAGKGMCVIDLDTVMPGYFISDVGDMMRTYLAEANEEEQDLDKIVIRDNFFEAICNGYLEEMGNILTPNEKDLFIYSGKFMIYMQALRFLTDFLNGDVYYQTKYPGHNLKRAKNQLRLLELYLAKEDTFKQIIQQFLSSGK